MSKKTCFVGLSPKERQYSSLKIRQYSSVKIPCVYLGLWTPPIHRHPLLGQSPKKKTSFLSVSLQLKIFGALKHHEMARYDLPTYVLYVSRHFWMFAVKITECVFSLKSLGLLTPTYPKFRTKS